MYPVTPQQCAYCTSGCSIVHMGMQADLQDLCPSTLCASACCGDLIFAAALSLSVCQQRWKDVNRHLGSEAVNLMCLVC